MNAISMTSPRVFIVGTVLALASTFALSAFAFGGHGGHGGRGGMGGQHIGRMLDAVDATPEQRAQIKRITDTAATERRAQHDARRALMDETMRVFSAPVVDANAVEALRQRQLQQHDQASRRMMQTMLEVSRVLTPEQRTKLAERTKQRREMAERHQRERGAAEPRK